MRADDRASNETGAATAAEIRVLTMDDDAEMRLLVCTLLDGRGGYESYFAFDGRPGMKMERRIMSNLILLDINMPGASGFDVLSAIRQAPGTSPAVVLMVSGSNSPADIRRAWFLHADGYITKPFSAMNLSTRLRKLASGCRSVESHPLQVDRENSVR